MMNVKIITFLILQFLLIVHETAFCRGPKIRRQNKSMPQFCRGKKRFSKIPSKQKLDTIINGLPTCQNKISAKNSVNQIIASQQDISTNSAQGASHEIFIPKPFEKGNLNDGQISKKTNEIDLGEIEISPKIHGTQNMVPAAAKDDLSDMLEINFEGTDLQNLLDWVSQVFNVSFLTDDIISPIAPGGRSLLGNKITFKTQTPVTKKQAWEIFVTFLDVFGLNLMSEPTPNLYRIVPTDPGNPKTANRGPLPAFINTNWQDLPDSETKIRYVYNVQNTSLAAIQNIVDSFRSTTSSLKTLPDLNLFILTDKSFNIRSIMQIVEELDSSSLPESMSVLKLKHADADDVRILYENLTKKEDSRGIASRLLGTKKLPTSTYFPEDLQVFSEKRTNTLIILGNKKSIKKFEEFIFKYVDTELKIPYSPLYIYELQYTKAEDIATILTNITKFAPDSAASQSGGVRDGDKYLRPMTFQAEPSGNRILINAEKDDYLKVLEIIKQLDVKQPQIEIEVLIVNVISNDDRELGTQLRNKTSDSTGKNINFQTSGLGLGNGTSSTPVVVPPNPANPDDPNAGSLLGNLIQLAQNQTAGAALLTISNLATGVWGILRVLQSEVDTNVVANPFLVATNNYTSQVSLGNTRRVQTGSVISQNQATTFGDISANLTVQITPLINNEGNINLNINISIDSFTDATNPTSPTKNTNTIKTNANVGDRQVLALGGLLKTDEVDNTTGVPILSRIPLIGWLFKNKTKIRRKNNLLVFICPKKIEPLLQGGIDTYSREKAEYAKQTMREMRDSSEKRDIIHKWFFKDNAEENTQYIDNFISRKYQADNYNLAESELYINNSSCLQGSKFTDQPCEQIEKNENVIESTNFIAGKIEPKQEKIKKTKNFITECMPENSQETIA